MIEETALVIGLESNFAYVEAQRKNACGQCAVQKGCGTGVLSNAIGRKMSKVRALNQIGADIGDLVVVGLSESGLLKSAFINYMLPLIFMFVFAVMSKIIFSPTSELVVIVGAMTGLVVSYRVIKRFAASIKSNPDYQPVILRKINSKQGI